MKDQTLGMCQAMSFEEWAFAQLLAICKLNGALDQTKDGKYSTYVVEEVRALVLALDHGDELQYRLDIAQLDKDEQEIRHLLDMMRSRDLDGAGNTRTAQEIAAAIADNELKRSAM
jgi:hypothetical protein